MSTELTARHVLDAVMDALMQMRIEEPEFEAFSATRDDEKDTVTVELQGPQPPEPKCVCPNPESDEIEVECDFCLYGGVGGDPDYLTVVVKLKSAVKAW